MKTFCLIVLSQFLIFTTTYTQNLLSYTDEQEVPDRSKEYLFVHIQKWLKENLKTGEVQVSDIEDGIVLGENLMVYNSPDELAVFEFSGNIYFDVDVKVAKGKYNLSFSNFELFGVKNGGLYVEYGHLKDGEYCLPKFGATIVTRRQKRILNNDVKRKLTWYVHKTQVDLKRYLDNLPSEKYFESMAPSGLVYKDSIPVNGLDGDRVFELCRLWFARSFNNSNEVLQEQDKQNGVMYARAYLPYQSELELDNIMTEKKNDKVSFSNFKGKLGYSMTIKIEDDFCKIVVADFTFINKDRQNVITDATMCMDFYDYPGIGYEYANEICLEFKEVSKKHAAWVFDTFNRHLSNYTKNPMVAYNNYFPKDMLVFQEVVKVRGATKAELLDKAYAFVSEYYGATATTMEILDEQSGELFCSNVMMYDPCILNEKETTAGSILFDVYIQVRDGEYSCSYANFRHEASPWLETPITLGKISNAEQCLEYHNWTYIDKELRVCKYIKGLIAEMVAEERKALQENMSSILD